MSEIRVADLLAIPPGVKRPNAYQVLGLAEGEQDAAKITAAIQRTANKIRSRKQEVRPEVYQRAVTILRQAQEVLTNREKKSALDAQYGIVSVDESAEQTGPEKSSQRADPLASFLPAGDPFAVSQSTARTPSAGAAAANAGAGFLEQAKQAADMPPPPVRGEPDNATPGTSFVVTADPSPRARRRRSSTAASLMLGSIALALLILVGALAYFLIAGPGSLEIASGDGTFSIRTGPSQQRSRVAAPRPEKPVEPPLPKQPDPVLGELATTDAEGDGPAARSLGDELSKSGQTRMPPGDQPAASDAPEQQEPAVTEITKPASDASISTANSGPQMQQRETADQLPVNEGKDSASSGDPQKSTASEADAAKAIQEAAEAIRSAEWKQMKPLAKRASEIAATGEQKQRAQSLYELADLASYYRGGIERAIAPLSAGNEISIGSVKVVVVEANRDSLTIRRSARSHRYTLDELPPSLAHALALHSMAEDDPNAQAAKWVYQAIAPGFHPDFRKQSLNELANLGDGLQGADAERLVDAIDWLYPD